jgi:uncharacterized protein YecT (DUF1311 family)
VLRPLGCLATVLFCLAAPLRAQQAPDPSCTELLKTPLPPEASIHPPNLKADRCASWDIYYKQGNSTANERARDCAFIERENAPADPDLDAANDANATLAMIYAGGHGVAPNLKLATRFACEIQGRVGYANKLVQMLNAKRLAGATSVNFDVCDYQDWEFYGFCTALYRRKIDREREAEEKQFQIADTPRERAAFQQVLRTRKLFLDAHGREASGGTSDSVQGIEDDRYEDDKQWTQDLKNFAAGKLPSFTEEDFKKADADLNTAYREALKDAAADSPSSDIGGSPQDIQKAERAWLRYREAWVAYAHLRWPQIAADTWRAWLSNQRAFP